MMPILLALAAAAGAAAPANLPANLKACTGRIASAPERTAAEAEAWAGRGGGVDARLCQGLALAAAERWPAAAAAFALGADEAGRRHDPRVADLLVQAGNAWLAANEPAKAVSAFDSALSAAGLEPQLAGEVHLDRARARVAQGDPAAARLDLDKALALVPNDPFAWYLSAALARRQGDLKRARADIAKAASLAPDDSSVLLEAGNIAAVSDDVDAAKGLYARAARAQPGSEAARAARAALAANAEAPR